ncbi:MAG: cupin domain-containing protein [Candidatus Promineifilaceae bacterium]|nr:cupin domain-containing protein [Candidatus Promineifilaceae bacterium]
MSDLLQANVVVPDLSALVVEISEESIISRTVYKDDGVRVILFGFAEGETLSEHTSAYPAILHFLEGEAAVILGEESIAAQPGTWVHMPAHLPHSIEANTKVKMLLLMLTS